MGNFRIPLHQYIINTDEQAKLMGDAGAGPVDYDNALDLTPGAANHKFSLIGEIDWTGVDDLVLLAANTRIRAQGANNGVAQVLNITAPGTALAGDVFRIVTDMPTKEDTAFQNIPLEKRYQIAVDCADANAVAAAMAAAINADEHALVTASAATAVLTIEDKIVTQISNVYSTDLVLTTTVTTPAVAPVNVYDTLKNVQWANSVDFDRNAEYYPEKGASYKSYYFQTAAETTFTGGHSVPSQAPVKSQVEYVVYVKVGLALEAAMDALVTDMNA